jgi:D-lactate dehydrogenase (cytochrome)
MSDIETALEEIHIVVGPNGISDEPEVLAPRLVEERGLYHGRAAALVRPGSADETAKVLGICNKYGVAVVPQGGNTGLVGGGVPDGGIILDTGRMNAVRALDEANRTITVDAGCVLADVQAAAEEAGLLFPLSLAAEGTCQIGGNLATNAGGIQVLRYGNARELVLGLEVALPDGRVWDGLRALRKNNTGYDLKHLFVGSEGTLGVITAAVLKLFPLPRTKATVLAAMADVDRMVELFVRIQAAFGDGLTAFEMISRRALDFTLRHIPGVRDPFAEPHAQYALIEVTSTREDPGLIEALEADLGRALGDGVVEDAVVAASGQQADELWRIRESIPEAQKSEGGSIKHDIAVPVSAIPRFVAEASAAVQAEIPGIRICCFGHIGDGNLHFNLSQPADMDKPAFVDRWHAVNRMIHEIVMPMGGTFSAEHGIGQLKLDELEHYRSAVELDMMRTLKRAFDPKGIMNPGKVVRVEDTT